MVNLWITKIATYYFVIVEPIREIPEPWLYRKDTDGSIKAQNSILFVVEIVKNPAEV